MKIILEGCDGVGKTTLAKILADKYGMDICHCTQNDPNDFKFYLETVRKDNVIWDRHTIGELIYPAIFNRKQNISYEDAKLIIYRAKSNGVKIFVLSTSHKTIEKRLKARKTEHEKIMNAFKWIDDQFTYYAKEFNIPIIDTSKMTLQEIFDLMEE